MSCETMSLQDLVRFLQQKVAKGGLTSRMAADAAGRLEELGYAYEHAKFPALAETTMFPSKVGSSPSSLAEALLWKVGKWKDYRKIVSQYANDASVPGKSDIVFFAFARHLKNPAEKPIYDQHALRAMWAICTALTAQERGLCEHFLMSGDRRRKGQGSGQAAQRKWKQTGNGKTAADCYALFLKHFPSLQGGATNREIDLVLMPLGKAIKKETSHLAAFTAMCGWKA